MKSISAYLFSLIAHFMIFVGKAESASLSFHGFYQPDFRKYRRIEKPEGLNNFEHHCK
ncbi:cyclic lactone autoinducer peptide [Erysipelotrichaceae bacterium Oil+RF-744-GAM-WT-6]|uniref:Cyclic lactone autoinducer peptide n=1 Tax=Stecheria intestinalis TaxID=2606630 RepID=A0A7X2NSG5_9FIRM|nr:cyclic lactone autoinducer peptide [Stecheria intestinalis]